MGLAKQSTYDPTVLEDDLTAPPTAPVEIEPEEPKKVGFVGLGAMGRPMSLGESGKVAALTLVLHKAGVNVVGYDVWEGARKAYATEGGTVAENLLDTARDADVFLLIVVNAAQVDDILFGQGGLALLAPDAVVLIMATIPASDARRISERVKTIRPDVSVIDAPVSGAVPRAVTGDLTVFTGGLEDAGKAKGKAYRVLRLLSSSQGNDHYLVRVPGGVGRGSSIKLSNQHLAITQISGVAEIQALAAKIGLPGRKTNALLMTGPGWSWVLGHRGVSMLNGLIKPPQAAIDILVKDMGIVVTEAGTLRVPIPLGAFVQQQLVFAKSLGWGGDDDSGYVHCGYAWD